MQVDGIETADVHVVGVGHCSMVLAAYGCGLHLGERQRWKEDILPSDMFMASLTASGLVTLEVEMRENG